MENKKIYLQEFINKYKKQNYLNDNEKLIKNIGHFKNQINEIGNSLKSFEIDIFITPWYKNIFNNHLNEVIKSFNNCKKSGFDSFIEFNDKWMRTNFKSFMSEIEKFIKFYINEIKISNNNQISFFDSINLLNDVENKYCHLYENQNQRKAYFKELQNNLHQWREIYNVDKHDETSSNSHIKFDKKLNKYIVIDNEPISYIEQTLSNIIFPLLTDLCWILKNKTDK